ncbi:multidrug resistance-associated ABC transporter [Mycena galopus ATCC 62051]|nr:multidrug resistance-associated ABC transporter [Mycena galopus ATCC 62051]
MGSILCLNSDSNPFALQDPCIRASWSAILPAVLVLLLCIASIPVPAFIKRFGNPFQPFLTMEEAENFFGAPHVDVCSAPRTRRTTVVLVSLALIEILLWTGVGVLEAVSGPLGMGRILPFIFATSWCYAFLRPLIQTPIITAPMDLFWLFSLEFVGAVVLLGGMLLGYGTTTETVVIAFVANAMLTTSLLVVVLRLPLGVPIRKPLPDDLEPSPEDYTSLFGWMTFAWVFPLIQRGKNNSLAEKDVWNLSPTMQARPVFYKFTLLRRTTVLRSLLVANSSDLILDGILSVLSVFLNFSGPFFLNLILSTLEHPGEGGRRPAYLYAFLAFACQIAKSESDLVHYFYGRRASTRMKTELMVAIYDKALKRCDFTGIVDAEATADAKANGNGKTGADRPAGKQDEKSLGPKAGAQLGKIVNLMSVDTNTVSNLPSLMFWIYAAPFDVALSVLFLYRFVSLPSQFPDVNRATFPLGWAAFSGMAFMLLSLPLNWAVAKLGVKYEKGIVTARDKRTSVVNELISSIKFIKFGGAEEQWLKKATDAREVELDWLRKIRFVRVFTHLTWLILPVFISVSSFYVYIKQGNNLTVATALTALAVFNMLNVPMAVVPYMINQMLQASVAISRISKFLEEDEVSDEVSALKFKSVEEDESPSAGLVIESESFGWNELAKDAKIEPSASAEETRFELRDISVSFPEGKLTCVVGPTASGKTALLQALLGEMTCLSGTPIKPPKSSKVDENGLMHCMSYSAQTPWLQYASIKDNIIFGFPFDAERYQSVLDACALRPDLAILPDGDRTEIGIRGVTLSGGQKARVALARAVYAWTKYVLLDDPLSAVDSHTARILFDKLFRGPLLKNRTVVLVTHHLDLLLSGKEGSGAHYVVRMLNGRIDAQGTVQDLRARGLLEALKHDSKHESPADMTTAVEEKIDKSEGKLASSQPVTKLVEDEEQAKGDVEWRIYKTYLKASGYTVWATILAVILVIEMIYLGQKLWIKVWGEAYQPTPGSYLLTLALFQGLPQAPFPTSLAPVEFPPAENHPMFYVLMYMLFGLGIVFLDTAIASLHLYGAFRASRRLFHELLNKLVYSTFRWFDATPKGRILNRIGKDIATIDNTLSGNMSHLTHSSVAFVVQILVIAVVFPFFIIPGLVLAFTYYQLSVRYLKSSRDLRRMEANTRSPIFTGFSELLEGIVTVRAFGVEKRFLSGFFDNVDLTTRLGYTFTQANRWLLLNFDYLGATAVLITSLFSVSTFVSAGVAGICINSATTFSRLSFGASRHYTDLQVDLNAVERVVNYLEIPQEPPAIIESNRPPAYWPSSSSSRLLVVEDLEVKYAANLPSVLHGITFALKARERVGILGRTGSGKSTLATSLLRFVEPTRGRIIVDGIDISTIGLHDLRTRLTFIPQDACLFSGTLRQNLDPFDEYEDTDLEGALYRVHLMHRSARASTRGSPVAELETDAASVSGISSVTVDNRTPMTISLDTMISGEGANFSHGQRQLIMMAGALLRQSSIVILDEATSSIDFETDRKIQTAIREELTDSLLVTIAHRINSVIDYDRLIVLDQGKIAEFDTPYNLIQAEGSIFREMCMKTGAFEELEAAAKKAKALRC